MPEELTNNTWPGRKWSRTVVFHLAPVDPVAMDERTEESAALICRKTRES